jgi:hypothetical protein
MFFSPLVFNRRFFHLSRARDKADRKRLNFGFGISGVPEFRLPDFDLNFPTEI